jgi:hypothetical protein
MHLDAPRRRAACTWSRSGTKIWSSCTDSSVTSRPGIGLVSTSISVCTLIQPRLGQTFHFSHPLAPVRDLDPGAIGGDDDILSEEPGNNRQREIQALDPAKEGGIIRRHKTGNEGRKFPDKPPLWR